jgi:ankyrin repeat protein
MTSTIRRQRAKYSLTIAVHEKDIKHTTDMDATHAAACKLGTTAARQQPNLRDLVSITLQSSWCSSFVVLQLPMHPLRWNMMAATCSELRKAVGARHLALRKETRSKYRDMHRQVAGSDKWMVHQQLAGKLLVQLVMDRQTAEVMRLVVNRFPVDGRGRSNTTALIWAAQHGETELATILIGVGAQLDLQDDDGGWTAFSDGGWTALMRAYSMGHRSIAVALINAGTHLDLPRDSGYTVLMDACRSGDMEFSMKLITAGATLDLQNAQGWSALMLAADCGRTEIAIALIKALVNEGAQLDLLDFRGVTALMRASTLGRTEVAMALINAGAKQN